MDHKCRLRGLSDSIKLNYICIIGVSEEEERGKEAEGLFGQIIAENDSNLGKEASKGGTENSYHNQQKHQHQDTS